MHDTVRSSKESYDVPFFFSKLSTRPCKVPSLEPSAQAPRLALPRRQSPIVAQRSKLSVDTIRTVLRTVVVALHTAHQKPSKGKKNGRGAKGAREAEKPNGWLRRRRRPKRGMARAAAFPGYSGAEARRMERVRAARNSAPGARTLWGWRRWPFLGLSMHRHSPRRARLAGSG